MGIKFVRLTMGAHAIVDEDRFPDISKFKWHLSKVRGGCGYAKRVEYVRGEGGCKRKTIYMHQQVVGQKGVDHINGDTLDNRGTNLRACTHRNNIRNKGRQKNNTSGFKGVSWCKIMNRWVARIKTEGGHYPTMGYFCKAEEAAEAYDFAAIMLFGEFARTNFKEGPQ